MIKKIGIGLLILGLVTLGYILLTSDKEILNPLGKKLIKEASKKNHRVYGFLPSWSVGKTKIYSDEISDLIFLGVEVDGMGNLVWDNQGKKIYNEDFLKQKKKIRENGGRNILGIKLFDDNKIDELMASESAKLNLIEQIKKTMTEDDFDGVNVDFEYQGNPTAVLEDEFISFMVQMRQSGIKEISIDVFANTIIKGLPEQINKMLEAVDTIIVMAYDFHRSGSTYAGPVAPIGAPIGERNILEVVSKVNEAGLERKKIVLAYPLYGYEWKTISTDFGSATKKGWIAMASYKRMKEMLANKNQIADLKEAWDETSMSPWISFSENNEIHQIYFENLESLKRKLQLMSDNQLGGVGFWALGYEGEYVDIWEEIDKL